MLAGIRKRLARKTLDIKEEDDDKDDIQAFTPPANYITISQGKIQLVHQQRSVESDATTDTLTQKDREALENRIVELEAALSRLQERVNNSHCVSPTFEKELREQLENMNRVIKSKERKQKQICPGHKTLQTRFSHQENLLRVVQQEDYTLKRSIRHYERCLDDVMRKVVDAIVAEDILREEVAMLKNRVHDLEAQNAALSASPEKGRDEGYCTMSSGQPQPSNGHLEDLPEEPEQWLLPAEPCSTEMEDWSMSQEELPIVGALDDEQQHNPQHVGLRRRQGEHDWIWNSNDFLTSTTAETDSESEAISQLLQQKIVYSEDEDMARTEFTNEFYKLVDIRSASARSLFSYVEGETDDEDDDDEEEEPAIEDGTSSLSARRNIRLRCRASLKRRLKPPSPTPSEAGRAQLTSCSSSETDELSRCTTTQQELNADTIEGGTEEMETQLCGAEQSSDIEIEDIELERDTALLNEQQCIEAMIRTELGRRSAEATATKQPMTPTRARTPPPPPPAHSMVKSKSMLHKAIEHEHEKELNELLRLGNASFNVNGNGNSNGRALRFVRSESVNGVGHGRSSNNGVSVAKLQERLQQRPANSWRKSSGWKRVTSPACSPTAPSSPKKEVKAEIVRNCVGSPAKTTPTRIPTCVQMQQPQSHQTSPKSPREKQSVQLESQPQIQPPAQTQLQLQPVRKSKIPPPVPVRRSYAS